jgi:DHA2 family multidrug resistance protein
MNHAGLANSTTPFAFFYREVMRQAMMLAFNDTFWLLAWLTAIVIPLTLLFRGTAAKGLPGAGLH